MATEAIAAEHAHRHQHHGRSRGVDAHPVAEGAREVDPDGHQAEEGPEQEAVRDDRIGEAEGDAAERRAVVNQALDGGPEEARRVADHAEAEPLARGDVRGDRGLGARDRRRRLDEAQQHQRAARGQQGLGPALGRPEHLPREGVDQRDAELGDERAQHVERQVHRASRPAEACEHRRRVADGRDQHHAGAHQQLGHAAGAAREEQHAQADQRRDGDEEQQAKARQGLHRPRSPVACIGSPAGPLDRPGSRAPPQGGGSPQGFRLRGVPVAEPGTVRREPASHSGIPRRAPEEKSGCLASRSRRARRS